MKKNKLWIWSFILGLLATFVLFLIIKSSDDQKTVKTDAQAINSTEAKGSATESALTVTNQGTTQQTSNNSKDGQEGSASLPISEGKRAMSIQVPEVQGVAGYLKPGAHVDVVGKLAVPADAKPGQYNAETVLLQNVKVLALGHAADAEDAKKRYQIITFEVSPQEALTLGFASKYEFYLLLRKEGDDKLEPDHFHVFENQLHEGVFVK